MIERVLVVAAIAGCGEAIDPSTVDSIADYQTWSDPIVVIGNAPGHTDSYRRIFVNDVAAGMHDLSPGYPAGSIIVKEIYDLVDGERMGDLRYLGIMRRIDADDEGGWLFTDQRDGVETYHAFCWARCHVAAPYNGAWYDYRR